MHNHFMQRALELAKLGQGNVSPNPMVGCVIVHQNEIIGEGWHQKYGESHAEVNAIHAVKNQSKLSEATVYVTLEPCSHFGKTPPCADLLIKHQVKKVVICNKDPFHLVAGQGIEKLQNAGIEVVTGVLEEEGKKQNARFFTFVEKKRPYIILKWAETADGFIGGENYERIKISNDFSHQLVHKWRSEEEAILVGYRTALYDNPSLNVRFWTGKNPIRIVIDRHLQLPQNLHLFDNNQRTLIINEQKNEIINQNHYIKLENFSLNHLLNHLFELKIQSVLIEGGASTLQSFIDLNLFDEIRVFKSLSMIKKGIFAPILPKNLKIRIKKDIFGDELNIYEKISL
jgi:diaminohydroxyphosphoribosylaminopyrimidine deaminase/5-amino-6-(5-phosphoribosylamino)uracil reductase